MSITFIIGGTSIRNYGVHISEGVLHYLNIPVFSFSSFEEDQRHLILWLIILELFLCPKWYNPSLLERWKILELLGVLG